MANKSRFRADINGLRAVAVLAVVVNHLGGYPLGGFVGVDIFFVISGYLITGQLVRAVERDGRVGYSSFYRKRVRRILPAALVTLITTVVASFFILRSAAAAGVLQDGIWSAVSLGNWHFAAAGTDYWAESAQASPLQHFWSLAVEEQYYVVWPVLISVVAFLVLRARPNTLRPALLTAIVTVMALSFGWAVLETARNESFAYFDTAARAWELGAGSALALLPNVARVLGRPGRIVLTWLGLAGIAVAIVISYEDIAFPGPGAALAIASTCAVILGGSMGERAPWILANPASKYIGEISFSLYLWHFPVIVYLAVFMDAATWQYTTIVLVASFALAALSYHLVESPVRRSSWLEDGWFRRPDFTRPAVKGLIATTSIAALMAVMVVAEVKERSQVAAIEASIAARVDELVDSAAEADTPEQQTATATLAAEITAATKVSEWPAVTTPAIDTVLEDGRPKRHENAGCERTDVDDPTSCSFGNQESDKSIVVLGSSVALTLLPTVEAAYGADHAIRGFTMSGCTLLDLEMTFTDEARKASCLEQRADVVRKINELQPDYVFVAHAYSGITGLTSGATGSAATAEWQEGAEKFIADTAASAPKIVFVPSAPAGTPIETCGTKFSKPADCHGRVGKTYRWAQAAEAKAAASSDGRAVAVDTQHLYCTESGLCPAFVRDTIVKRDDVHVTPQYAEKMAPAYKELLDPVLTAAAA